MAAYILYILLFICLKSINEINGQCVSPGQACSDCRTMRFCVPLAGLITNYDVKCENINADKPYCNQKTSECSNDESLCELEALCFGEGYLPYPTNCKYYMICVNIQQTLVGAVYKCPEGTVYSHTLKGCAQMPSCFDFSNQRLCTNKSGRIVTYPPDESIYAWCSPDNQPWVYRCPEPYIFDRTVGKCKPICRKSGKIVNVDDPTKFYECIRIGNGYVILSRDCPEGTTFNGVTEICDWSGFIPNMGFGPLIFPEDVDALVEGDRSGRNANEDDSN